MTDESGSVRHPRKAANPRAAANAPAATPVDPIAAPEPVPAPPPAAAERVVAADIQAGPVTVSRVSRARVRPRGSREELIVWYLMRVTAVALFVLVLAHFSITHFIWDPATENAQFIADERWNQIFWRGFDWLLLTTVLIHAFLGVRTVVLDYVHRAAWRTGTLWLLYVIGILLFVLGTQVIVALPLSSLVGPM